jgi:hypothetical protein
MVSKTLASLDAWLAQAEQVLAEQSVHYEPESDPTEPVQLNLFGGER